MDVSLCGLEGSALAYMLARIGQELNQPLFIVIPSLDDAQKIAEALKFFLSCFYYQKSLLYLILA